MNMATLHKLIEDHYESGPKLCNNHIITCEKDNVSKTY